MKKKIKKVLITGSEGFIGSHVVELFLKKGFEVNAFILYNFSSNRGFLENLSIKKKSKINYFFGDICDVSTIKPAMRNCDAVLNLAALIGIPYSYNAPSSYINVNIKGTLNLLNCALENKIKKFIHTSTSEVYGSAQFVPITEKHPLEAQSPYAATKIGADHLVNSYNKSFGLKTLIIRPFNTFGPRQSSRAVIPTIINQALFKNKIKIGNIHTKRDFTFVSDTAEAYYKGIISGNKTNGKIINLGTGCEFSIKEIIQFISRILNKKLNILSDKKRVRPPKSEVNRLLSSNLMAKKLLFWKPKYINKKGFCEGLKITIDHLKKSNIKRSNKLFEYTK